MKKYTVNRPCPELGQVLERASREVERGEEFVVESNWEYVIEDLKSVAAFFGFEILDISKGEINKIRMKRK